MLNPTIALIRMDLWITFKIGLAIYKSYFTSPLFY